MRKGTKKKIIHGILIIFVIIFALLVSLVAAFRDITVQSMLARSFAGHLSKKLGTDVKIRTFYLNEKLRLIMEDMQINDLYGYPLLDIGLMNARFSPTLNFDDIKIRDIYLKDVLTRVVKYEGDQNYNIADLLAKVDLGEDSGEPMHLTVDKLRIENGRVEYWNQNGDNPEKKGMDYWHIDVSDINGFFNNIEMRNDSIFGDVVTLRGIEKSGFTVDDCSFNVTYCDKSLDFDNLIINSNESHLDLDLRFEYDYPACFYEFIDSVRIVSTVRPTTLLLSDLFCFSRDLSVMHDKFHFTANFDGLVKDFTVSNFVADFGEESSIDADLRFVGLPEFFETFIDANIRSLKSNYTDTKQFAIPIEAKTIPVPDALADLGSYTLSGMYLGYPEDFTTHFDIASEIGNVNADIQLNVTENSSYNFNIAANDINLASILGWDDEAKTSLQLNMTGRGLDVDDTNLDAELNINSLKINGNDFEDIYVYGGFNNKSFTAFSKIIDPKLFLSFYSVVDLNGKSPHYSLKADVKNADLRNLHLLDYDTIMVLTSNIDLDFTGDDIDNITGNARIENTKYYNGTEYCMDDFSFSISEPGKGIKDVNLDCDFFTFNGNGIVSFKALGNAVQNIAKRYLKMPGWFENTVPDNNKYEFWMTLFFKDTQTLTNLFVPTLSVSNGTKIFGVYDDGMESYGVTFDSPEIYYNGLRFKNIDARVTARYDDVDSEISVGTIIFRDSTEYNPDPIKLEDITLKANYINDLVDIDLYWDDKTFDDHNKAWFNATFQPHEPAGGLLTINADRIIVNDTIWSLDPNCSIDFKKHRTEFKDIVLSTDSQMMSVHGVFPTHNTDTLYATFTDVDVSDFDFITLGDGVNLDGKINGFLNFSGLNEDFSFSSDIDLQGFHLNGQEVGNVLAGAKWSEPKESIFINMVVYDVLGNTQNDETVGLIGYYYPRKKTNNIKFDMVLNDFKLETASPFISSYVDRVSGKAKGSLQVRGSVSRPVILGSLKLKDAGCRVDYLNTYYRIKDDEIQFERDKIIFDNVTLNDTLGNKATLNGAINHDHLKDYNFDLNLSCDNFLAFNIPVEKADGFYGTAITDGSVDIKGPIDNITMTIDATTKRGTEIDVPLSGSTTLENDFVVFVKKNQEADTLIADVKPEVLKKTEEYNINLNASVTPDAVVNIYLPQNMGSINARGSGDLTIGVTNKDFELRGNYLINSGSFTFALEMVKRTFTLRRGGSIRWTGDPTDADINIVGVLRTKSSLTSLGTSVVDSTALTNNINVDCIIKLSDKLMNPTITFGIELPNAKEDTKNLVYSVIDTTNQAVMAQQVFSLMMLGSFSYTAGSNITRFGTTAGYSVITNQLSNWLSQISKDFDVGINYTPNDNLTNEEIEVALSTQLFEDRLIIEGNFGVIRGNRNDADNANNIVGDLDLTFRITKRLSFKAYNHTNIKNNYYYYSYENYSDFTQGIGFSFSQSFDNIREIFTLNRKNKDKKLKLTNNESKPE